MAKKKREISRTAIPYKNYVSITSDSPQYEVGGQEVQITGDYHLTVGSQNVMTSATQYMERIPGFADKVESVLTTFTALKRVFWWALWGGSRFICIVNDVSGGVSKVYKCEVGVDASFVLIFTSASSNHFDFVVSNNTLYMGNGTEMRKYSGTGSSTTKWGITRPAAPVSTGTTGTGISAYSGWFYRVTYGNSTTEHESSASDLSPCTGIVSNKTVTLPLVASTDTQVDQIHVYRTTDGGSTDPTEMLEISGSPFTNTTATINDATADTSLSTQSAPSTTSNDPPTASAKLCTYTGRIFSAINATTYYSALEEMPARGVPEESWPSGLDGNSQPWPAEVTAQQPMADGVAIFTRGKIFKIGGNRRDNFVFGGLLDRRGALSQRETCALGNSVGWFDTASQIFLDGEEIGFDIRTDLKNVDHTQAYIAIHIQGTAHWLAFLDGANGKVFFYDMDLGQWLPPKVLPAAAAGLASGEKAAGSVVLTTGLSRTQVYMMNPAKYNDGGATYAGTAISNLIRLGEPDGKFEGLGIETNASTATTVQYLFDDDPSTGTYLDISENTSLPIRRKNGVNLIKTFYKVTDGPFYAERVSVKAQWAAKDANFTCNTITINPVLGEQSGQ